MTSKERVEAVFSGEIPDKVPIFEQLIVSKVASAILGGRAITGGGKIWKTLIEFLRNNNRNEFVERYVLDVIELYSSRLEMDIVPIDLMPPKEIDPMFLPDEIAPNTFLYKDIFGEGTFEIFQFNPISGEFFVIDSSIRRRGIEILEKFCEKILERLSKDVIFEEGVWDAADRIREKLGDEKTLTISQVLSIPIELTWLEALILRSDLVEIYLDWRLQYSLALIKEASRHGIDFINGGGDLADKNGPIYSPKIFRKLMLPRFKRLIEYCHELSLWYIFRTDGNVWPIADMLFEETGTDGYGGMDIMAGMDLSELKLRFPNLVLLGNLDCGKLLVEGTKEMIWMSVKECFEKWKPGGRYIFGSSNAIHWSVPPDNFLWMREVAERYRDY